MYIRIAWCAQWQIFLGFFFWRNSDHKRTSISPWQWDTTSAVSFFSSFYYQFPLRIAQHADRAIIYNKQWLVLILSRLSAAGKSVLPVAKWCASVRTSTGCICGQLARTTSSLLFGRSQVCCTYFSGQDSIERYRSCGPTLLNVFVPKRTSALLRLMYQTLIPISCTAACCPREYCQLWRSSVSPSILIDSYYISSIYLYVAHM